jgi:hypothetical protein
MNFTPINKSLNIETMQLETTQDILDAPPLFVRGTSKQKSFVIKGCPRPGRSCSYPWKDTSYEVGDWFWKAVSIQDWDAGRGRPNTPPPKTIGGRVWRTSKAYREDTKQHGYFVERVG